MKNTILKVAVTILAFLSSFHSLTANQHGLSENSLKMAKAWGKSDKSVAADFRELLADRTFKRLNQKLKQKVFNYTLGSRKALSFFASRDFQTYGGKYKRFMFKRIANHQGGAYEVAFKKIITDRSFSRLSKKLMFSAFKRNPVAIKGYPKAAHRLVDMVNFHKAFKRLDHYTKLLVYRIAAQYPAGIKAISNFIKTKSFKSPKFDGNKYSGNKQLVRLQGRQLQIIGVLGERMSLAKNSQQKELLKNTLAALASGRVELRIISSGRDGEAADDGSHIEINYRAHKISLYNVQDSSKTKEAERFEIRNRLVSTVAHEINHCTRPMKPTATFATFRDEYCAYYVGRIAATGKVPTVKQMLKDIDTLNSDYETIRMAYMNRREKYKIEAFINQIKRMSANSTAPFVFGFSKNNSMGGSSYASTNSQPSNSALASSVTVDENNVGLLGAQASKVEPTSTDLTSPTSGLADFQGEELLAANTASDTNEAYDGVEITYDENDSFIDG